MHRVNSKAVKQAIEALAIDANLPEVDEFDGIGSKRHWINRVRHEHTNYEIVMTLLGRVSASAHSALHIRVLELIDEHEETPFEVWNFISDQIRELEDNIDFIRRGTGR